MRLVPSIGAAVLASIAAHGAATITPWAPIFQGIDQATGTNSASNSPVVVPVDAATFYRLRQ